MRNRASGFCYVADAVLGIMLLAKEGRPRHTENEDPAAKMRRPRIMYLDLDLHYGDGVAQAFLSPTHYPSSIPPGKKPPRPPQVLTLSIHHHSPIFFPPHTAHSGLPSPDSPHPFTLSLPLAAYPSSSTYARLWGSCVEPIKKAFDPDYIVLQLGTDGLTGDPIGRYGAWSVDGEGGVVWCVEKVKGWGRPTCVLGGGGYDHANTARAWALATSVLVSDQATRLADVQVGRPLHPDTAVPDFAGLPEFAPSFTLEVPHSTSDYASSVPILKPLGNVPDENTDASLSHTEAAFKTLAVRIRSILAAYSRQVTSIKYNIKTPALPVPRTTSKPPVLDLRRPGPSEPARIVERGRRIHRSATGQSHWDMSPPTAD